MATVLGELGDLSRFTDPRQAQKMAGLNLTQISAGHHQGQTHIAKRGWPAARAVLYQAACVAVANDSQWQAWYRSLTRRAAHPPAPKAAMVAVATKLLRVAWACMKHGQVYDAARFFPAGRCPLRRNGRLRFGSVSGVGSRIPPFGLSLREMTP